MLEYLELPLFLQDSLQVPWKKSQESERVFGDAGGLFLAAHS